LAIYCQFRGSLPRFIDVDGYHRMVAVREMSDGSICKNPSDIPSDNTGSDCESNDLVPLNGSYQSDVEKAI
jgi:hypothetical protein